MITPNTSQVGWSWFWVTSAVFHHLVRGVNIAFLMGHRAHIWNICEFHACLLPLWSPEAGSPTCALAVHLWALMLTSALYNNQLLGAWGGTHPSLALVTIVLIQPSREQATWMACGDAIVITCYFSTYLFSGQGGFDLYWTRGVPEYEKCTLAGPWLLWLCL